MGQNIARSEEGMDEKMGWGGERVDQGQEGGSIGSSVCWHLFPFPTSVSQHADMPTIELAHVQMDLLGHCRLSPGQKNKGFLNSEGLPRLIYPLDSDTVHLFVFSIFILLLQLILFAVFLSWRDQGIYGLYKIINLCIGLSFTKPSCIDLRRQISSKFFYYC